MAFAKQTFVFIFIVVHIIFAPSSAAKVRPVTRPRSVSVVVKADSAPSPGTAAGPATKKGKEISPSPEEGSATTTEVDEGLLPIEDQHIDKGPGLPPKPSNGDFGSVEDVIAFVTKHMQAIEKKVTEFGATIKKKKDQPGTSSPETKACYTECDKDMAAAVAATKKTLESMQGQDLMQANFDVTAVMTHVGTCEACFEDLDEIDPEVKKLHEWVTYVSGDALDALQSKRPSPGPKG